MFDPVQLRSFVAVAETGSFTRAAEQLKLAQPTVSQHVRRLEQAARGVLINRESRTALLTDNGDAMLRHAREILAAHDAADAYFSRTAMRGRLRLGAADDLALTELPPIIRSFRRSHPQVNLALSVGQSAVMARRLRAGQLELAYVKQEPGLPDGRFVRRDRHAWVSHPSLRIDADQPVPLIAYPGQSLSRAAALGALDSIGRGWRVTCNVVDLHGALAAARAGIGLAVLPHSMVPDDLVRSGPALGLPALSEMDFVLLSTPRSTSEPVEALAAAILQSSAR
ncbi:MAG TPA: LysR substrate-binding domain-containing protein [Microbacterium sp.]|nr:LysR substrate-binding domain-containing protein [Microbacterium sp.]